MSAPSRFGFENTEPIVPDMLTHSIQNINIAPTLFFIWYSPLLHYYISVAQGINHFWFLDSGLTPQTFSNTWENIHLTSSNYLILKVNIICCIKKLCKVRRKGDIQGIMHNTHSKRVLKIFQQQNNGIIQFTLSNIKKHKKEF
jgi:hypothetical protein